MKVGGFTIIRNAVTHDYPVVESITSILPICSEFVVAVGESEDDTLEVIRGIDSPKIRIIETVWDESLSGQDGSVFAHETNKALSALSDDLDWGFYLQSDEVVHEKDLNQIKEEMSRCQDRDDVDGLLFNYLHFYGSYDYYASSPHWYRHEIRAFKMNRGVYSYHDAQGFRKGNGEKLRVKLVDAYIYHYGWVKEPTVMQRKRIFQLGYHLEKVSEEELSRGSFDYGDIDQMARFDGSHPRTMHDRISRKNWDFEYDLSYNRTSMKDRFKNLAQRYLGIELGYKNYKLVRSK